MHLAYKGEEVTIFGESEVRSASTLDLEMISAVEAGFAHLAQGEVAMPPTFQLLVDEFGGQTCIKGARVSGQPLFAVKIASLFPDPVDPQRTESHGMFVALESESGRIRACLFDGGYLTQIRTAAAGAVAAKYLAPREVSTVGVIGSGRQALLQIRALELVRSFERVNVWSRNAERADELRVAIETEFPAVRVQVLGSVSDTVRSAQVLITTTPSRSPIVLENDVHANLHITAVGSDSPGKSEIAASVVGSADLFVADETSQSASHGELQGADRGVNIVTLGEVVTGIKAGRQSEADLTIADLTGVGVQDAVAATLVVQRLLSQRTD